MSWFSKIFKPTRKSSYDTITFSGSEREIAEQSMAYCVKQFENSIKQNSPKNDLSIVKIKNLKKLVEKEHLRYVIHFFEGQDLTYFDYDPALKNITGKSFDALLPYVSFEAVRNAKNIIEQSKNGNSIAKVAIEEIAARYKNDLIEQYNSNSIISHEECYFDQILNQYVAAVFIFLNIAEAVNNSNDIGEVFIPESVQINNQIWMTKNLNVVKFSNGDNIPEAVSHEDWKKAGEERKPVWCHYDNNPSSDIKYGKLYNWFAINDARGLAPSGWQIPTKNDFIELMKSVHNNGNNLKEKNEGSESGKGTNNSGFSALFTVSRYFDGGFSYGEKINTGIWCSDEKNVDDAFVFTLYFLNEHWNLVDWYKKAGFCVRCIKI